MGVLAASKYALRGRSHARGVTLIMVAGVLAILAALGTAFYTTTVMQTRSSVRYSDSVRANLLASAGIYDAAARLRVQSMERLESASDPWYTRDWLNGGARNISFAQRDQINKSAKTPLAYSRSLTSSAEINSDRYTLNVVDSQSKININAGDNLAVTLDNLCRAVGPPLVAADINYLQPNRWAVEGAVGYDKNSKDTASNKDVYFQVDGANHPIIQAGVALYGDGYAIAGYRSRLTDARFSRVEDVRDALTYTLNPAHPELEALEREVKFQAIKDYITVDSWIDTSTVCTGKFEWINGNIAIDRDKSWVADDPADTNNHRGSLRGSYVSIINGHGAGQLRRIKTNGIDWIQLEQPFIVPPGPVSSYMIVAKPDLTPDPLDPQSGAAPLKLAPPPQGTLQRNTKIDYTHYPLCIHRAPVNINTAPDKVLVALFMGIDIQHGHPMAIGTQADLNKFADWKNFPNAWFKSDLVLYNNKGHDLEAKVLTATGLKRIPQDTGRLILDANLSDSSKSSTFGYLNNYGALAKSGGFVDGGGDINEAHELAYRVIMARQRTKDPKTGLVKADGVSDPDPTTADADTGFPGYDRGPIRSWDDFYFRVVKPWDDIRSYLPPDLLLSWAGRKSIPYSGQTPVLVSKGKMSVARLIMAHFNPNTDILKFNPNIEWIDRWGRNFTEMEPVMAFQNNAPYFVPGDGTHMYNYYLANSDSVAKGAYYTRSLRYKSDEMIDKTDINRGTTEFCFTSNGLFEIESRGQVVKAGALRAERQLKATVQAYQVWRETTQLQFSQGRFEAPGSIGAAGTNSAGRITRDGFNSTNRLPLNTLPEPIVPLTFALDSSRLTDLLDTQAPQGRDVWGVAKRAGMPDAVANRIFPATYDGPVSCSPQTCWITPTQRTA